MRSLVVAAIALSSIAAGGGAARAASLSSSKTFSGTITNSFPIVSNPSVGAGAFYELGKLSAGVASASVTVDTTADTGVIDDLDLTPISLTPSTVGRSFNNSVTVVTPNFPFPPIVETFSGQWTETITIDGFTGASPTFDSSSPQPMYVIPEVLPWYGMNHTGLFAATPFTLTGTYQMAGPATTTTIPLSIEFEPAPDGSFASIGIKGSNTFGNGFDFLPLVTVASYTIVNPDIFIGVVDGISFRVQFASNGADIYFSQNAAPEPAAVLVAAIAGLPLVAARRRR